MVKKHCIDDSDAGNWTDRKTQRYRTPDLWSVSLLLAWDDSRFWSQVYAWAFFAVVSTSLTWLASITTGLAAAAFGASQHSRWAHLLHDTRRLRRSDLRRIVESIWSTGGKLNGAEHDWL